MQRAGERDRARVVDERVDAAERVRGLLHSGGEGFGVAHVELQSQRAAAGGLHLRSDAVDRSGELRMRLYRLARHHDVGAVARAGERDLAPDAAEAPVMKIVLPLKPMTWPPSTPMNAESISHQSAFAPEAFTSLPSLTISERLHLHLSVNRP